MDDSKEETYRLALTSIVRWTHRNRIGNKLLIEHIQLVAKTALEEGKNGR